MKRFLVEIVHESLAMFDVIILFFWCGFSAADEPCCALNIYWGKEALDKHRFIDVTYHHSNQLTQYFAISLFFALNTFSHCKTKILIVVPFFFVDIQTKCIIIYFFLNPNEMGLTTFQARYEFKCESKTHRTLK